MKEIEEDNDYDKKQDMFQVQLPPKNATSRGGKKPLSVAKGTSAKGTAS